MVGRPKPKKEWPPTRFALHTRAFFNKSSLYCMDRRRKSQKRALRSKLARRKSLRRKGSGLFSSCIGGECPQTPPTPRNNLWGLNIGSRTTSKHTGKSRRKYMPSPSLPRSPSRSLRRSLFHWTKPRKATRTKKRRWGKDTTHTIN